MMRWTAMCVVEAVLLLWMPWAALATNAVERALDWLAAQQQPNGAWSTNVALQALPLLAHLSAGCTPLGGPRAAVVERGLRVLLAQQQPDGGFTGGGAGMYGQGIATLVLAEVSGMTRQPTRVDIALRRAVGLILRAQAVPKGDFHEGGWRYEPTAADSDLSVTIWQVMALRAAAASGLAIPQEALDRAVAYIRRCQHPSGGFGYQPGGLPGSARTAGALVALQACGVRDRQLLRAGRDWLAAHPLLPDGEFYYYGAHYAAQLGVGFDERALLGRQSADGSWPVDEKRLDDRRGGALYTTSMAVLALTAGHGFLPAIVPPLE